MEPVTQGTSEMFEPLAVLLGGVMVMTKTLAMIVFVALGGQLSNQPSSPAQGTQVLADLQVVFVAADENFAPSGPVKFQFREGAAFPAISLRLVPMDIINFGNFTVRHVGQTIGLEICGQVLTSPVLQEPIRNGELLLTGLDTIEHLLAYMNDGCP